MCFKNLPIEFDAQGNAFLKEGVANPYTYQTTSLADSEDKIKELLARNGFIKNVDFDPVTRVAGALAFHSVVDLQERTVLSADIGELRWTTPLRIEASVAKSFSIHRLTASQGGVAARHAVAFGWP